MTKILLLSLFIISAVKSSNGSTLKKVKSTHEIHLENKLENLMKKYSSASTKKSKDYYYRKIRKLLNKISERDLGIKKPRL